MMSKQQEKMLMAEIKNRARAVTVGTAFGGITEVSMRRPDGTHTFAILQPVEVTELIHQLAAGIGCHIQLVPRRDFASWRDWKYTEEELAHYRGVQSLPGVGHPPHPNDMSEHLQIGVNMPLPDIQPGMVSSVKENSNGETLAIETPKQRRKSKRTAITP